MKNSSEKEKKKSQTRSSIMKTIGNGNNVSYGVNVASFSLEDAINAVLLKAYFASLDPTLGYDVLPGVENRGPEWKYLSSSAQGRRVGAQTDGRTNCSINSTFFMYRVDGRAFIRFEYCDLICIFKNPQYFNPPLTKDETRDWLYTHGSIFCFGISGTCAALLYNVNCL
jgi:hypothetical protein